MRPSAERDAFLARECGGDHELRLEIESLLGARDSATHMSLTTLTPGTRIGEYEVTSFIAAGAMGQVYRGRDTKLGRDVALKILPAAFVSDPDRRTRFEREARVLASVNHPNIATIYGFVERDGISALALELVEGETLAERIARGKIPTPEALRIARQIAEALEAAHEQGIIHRDLKPANIKLARDGSVKVLDFGLAKLAEPVSGLQGTGFVDAAPSLSPTATGAVTGAHVLLGTPAYMSPEQARGEAVNERTDVWALGCVLYEMLAGKAAFAESTVTETLAAVLKTEPDWGTVPSWLHAVLGRCLQKNPKQRWRAAGDVAIELEVAAENAHVSGNGARPARVRFRNVVALSVTCLVAGSLLTLGVMWLARRPTPASIVTRFSFPIEAGRFTGTGRRVVAISPDGTQIAYTADDQLWLRRSNELDARPIPGTVFVRPGGTGQSLNNPVFSPDGQWIAFWSSADATLKKIATTGGAPVTICAATNVNGASWSGDLIVFGQENRGILAVSANGGTPKVIAATTPGELADGPHILPGGYVMFSVALIAQGAARWDTATVVAVPLKGGPRTTIIRGGHGVRYFPSGHLIYAVGGSLLAVPFDVERLRVTGGPVAVLEDAGESNGGAVGAASTGAVHFDVSQTGTLAYVPRSALFGGAARLSIVTVDRRGGEHGFDVPPQPFLDPRFSPEGGRIALSNVAESNDVWTFDVDRGTLARQTFEVGEDETPTWSPDGQWIAYTSIRGDQRTLFRRRSDGTGPEEVLWSASLPAHAHVQDWTAAGIIVALDKNNTGAHYELYVLGAGERSLKPLLQGTFNQTTARVSPDGRWLAYASNESGRYEVYVRPFPSLSGKWQISTTGGSRPVWSRRGDELFFRGAGVFNAVRVMTSGSSFAAGAPVQLFADRYDDANFNHTGYDVSLDGQRFVLLKPAEASSAQPGGRIVVVENWLDELRRLLPAN